MSVKKFKFVSPGIFLREIDQSQIPTAVAPIGPTIIGRSKRGPAFRPVQVNSFSEFVELFGEPLPGGGATGDAWRDGNYDSPTYASYAAQAWLANSETINFVRLLGSEADNPVNTTSNNGGRTGWTIGATSTSAPNGAYGLFVFPSASNGLTSISGTLAAVWYSTGSVPILSGTVAGSTSTSVQSNGIILKGDSGKFTVFLSGSTTNDTNKKIQFSFEPTSGDFIRKVFNTNPRSCDNGTAGPLTRAGLWLGETFENQFFLNAESFGSNGTADTARTANSNLYGMILPLNNYHDHLGENPDDHAARTGWYFKQSETQGSADPTYNPQSMTKLFRFVAIDGGDWIRSNVKIEIANIKPPVNEFVRFGTFDVVLRMIDDVDNNRKPLETFTSCNLDEASPNFISRKIGDTYFVYDSTKQRLIRQGQYDNISKYIRVELAPGFKENFKSSDLPFGVFGPIKPKTVTDTFANVISGTLTGFVKQAKDGFGFLVPSGSATGSLTAIANIKLAFPETLTRVSSSEDGLSNYKQASFGFKSTKTTASFIYDNGLVDTLRLPAGGLQDFIAGTTSAATEYSWYFTLDEVVQTGSSISLDSSTQFYYLSGSRANGVAYTATGSQTFSSLLDTAQVNSFCSPLQGGTDGFNVFEKDPLRNKAIPGGSTPESSYIYNTYRRAIDTIKDPEFIETNLVTIPGLAYEPLTLYLLQTAENRADCMAIIDASTGVNEPSYITAFEERITESARIKSPDDVVTRIKSRNLNSSYGATYYPWVQISDDTTGQVLAVPPSIVALGAMSYTDNTQAPWFAPAGFNRGGLSLGNSGLTVVNSVYRLTSQERDALYDVSVNPIASFPAEGLVIFGQKTLQATKSALDRINVRRLLLYVKRGISIIAKDILFEPNVEATWSRFVGRADPFLAEVKARFGVTDFRIVLDSTTTTPDLIDQNIMYAKIFIKPARAIEYIAVDFFITNTGASFAD